MDQKRGRLRTVEPDLSELLPTEAARIAYEKAAASLADGRAADRLEREASDSGASGGEAGDGARSFTVAEVQALSDAMWQVLDDMGEARTSVCLATKARARIAFEPFRAAGELEVDMRLDVARRIIDDVERR